MQSFKGLKTILDKSASLLASYPKCFVPSVAV